MRLINQNLFFLKNIFYLVFFLKLVSCNLLPTYTITQNDKKDKNFEPGNLKNKDYVNNKSKENLFEKRCLKPQKKIEIFFQFNQDEKYLKQILFDSPYFMSVSDVYEAIVKISLFQFVYHPHRVSFRSNWQLFIQDENKDIYEEITPHVENDTVESQDKVIDRENYFFDTLEYLLSKSKNKITLKTIIQEFERNFSNNIQLSLLMAQYVKDNQSIFKEVPFFESYFRAGEPLMAGEYYQRIRINKDKIFQARAHSPISQPSLKNNSLNINKVDLNEKNQFCNFKMERYEKGEFDIRPYYLDMMGWSVKNDKTIITMVSSLDWDLSKKFQDNKFLYSNNWKNDFANFCFFRSKDLGPLGLFSLKGRDPGQLLHHLSQYGVASVASKEDLEYMMDFSRHQIFTGPIRVGFESKKGSREQLDELLQLSIPIFHVDSLGQLIGSAQSKKNLYFFDDKRYHWQKVCL
ncbi:MAG: hypothetical protein QE271_12790 [Bacteriovoracaceae bacterium]|nr:hypothetical protein [Bacteriovoracaceae bacterium]